MTFLPIVERELRVASRRGWTYWTRVAGAGLVTLIAGGAMLIGTARQAGVSLPLGPMLMGLLEWLIFAGAVAAGVFLTADCLSEEKREGSLGLLFLTDLRGHDVVLGKLLATSLRAAHGLVAVFPVLGLSVLLGGVTGGEFWRVVLVLCNTLFFSLTLGMLVSAVSRDAIKAMSGTLLWLAIFLFGPFLMDAAAANGTTGPFQPLFAVASPGFALSQAGSLRLGNYWLALGVTHALGWVFLGLACLCVPHTWRQKAANPARRPHLPVPSWLGGSPSRRAARRAQALDRAPVAWLAARELWLRWAVPIFVFGGIGLFALVMIREDERSAAAVGATVVFYLLAVPFGLWVAAQASRFFTEGRRTGLLELLLATPITGAEIVRGHWSALRQIFLLPAIALLVLLAFGTVSQVTMTGGMSRPGQNTLLAYQIVAGVFGLATFVTGLWALAWFGMWMGLTSRTTMVALLKTVLFAAVLPWLALLFLQGMFMATLMFSTISGGGSTMAAQWIMAIPVLIKGLLTLGVDIGFVVVSRRKVETHFSEYVALGGRANPMALGSPTALRATKKA